MTNEILILQDLAKRYKDISDDEKQHKRRSLWRNHNSFNMTCPPIYVRAFAWHEMAESQIQCKDPLFQTIEVQLKQGIFRDSFNDDFIAEPWITVNAVKGLPNDQLWGVATPWHGKTETNAGVWETAIKEPEDIQKLIKPHHIINEEKTQENLDKVNDAIGDIIDIDLDRGPAHRAFTGDISTQLAFLRGLEQIMWDMYDRPEWLHELLAFMRDGILQTQEEAEKAGDWTLSCHQNQAIAYANELNDPIANSKPVRRSDLWYFCASQETTTIGPEMFNEFMLQYQIPIMEKFGLVAYGCCEDLSQKIGLLKQIKNLRRVAVSPMADLKKCVEQIGNDYVISYRPSPADMVSYDFDPNRVRRILREAFTICEGLCFDITLKDVETVEKDPERIKEWVAITREVINEFY